MFPKQRLRGGVPTFNVGKWAAAAGFLGAGGCGPGCGWGFLVPVAWLWLGCSGAGAVPMAGLDRAVAFSGFSRVGAVRMARVSCACPHSVSHGCLHAALHGCLCMFMLQMMTPYKGCIDVTML